jgi:DNA excision repair protein ERCC-3
MNIPGPLIVQSNLEILMEVGHPAYEAARDAIAPFTELVKSPEHIHTYHISHLSLWNAASTGLRAPDILERLNQHSKFPVPATVVHEVEEYVGRYGKIKLLKEATALVLQCDEQALMTEILHNKQIQPYILEVLSPLRAVVNASMRGHFKMALTTLGFPVEDLAGYVVGDALPMQMRTHMASNGEPFKLRPYQEEAARIFYASGNEKGGSGVIVLPCGSGKTVIGMAAMTLVQARTLILTPNITAARQWMRELIDKTTLTEDQVKEYSGERKEIGDVTVATYQILTSRRTVEDEDGEKHKEFNHFPLFSDHNWGLMVYDEVHLLPAPVFRLSAEMQATRRLGLTATLIREDGKEKEVFSLIGPKKYDIPWRDLEAQGWIATAECAEIRVELPANRKMEYAVAEMRDKIKLASTNPAKKDALLALLDHHDREEDRILIIGQYLNQLEELSAELKIPLITGKTKNKDRDVLYQAFRCGDLRILIVSKVGNFAIDLPDANVLIQLSGTFGSRQEEAQRLGRVLRPKKDGSVAHFYSVVTRESREQEFAMNRQLFLAEQGYRYQIHNGVGFLALEDAVRN